MRSLSHHEAKLAKPGSPFYPHSPSFPNESFSDSPKACEPAKLPNSLLYAFALPRVRCQDGGL